MRRQRLGTAVAALGICACALAAPRVPAASTAEVPERFAVVGGVVITRAQYEQALRDGVRQRYYHGQVPEAELDSYRVAVRDELIERTLLVQEADRRGIEPDAGWVEERLEAIDARYSGQPAWEQHRDGVLVSARAMLEAQSRIAVLEAQVRDVATPAEEVVRRYYEENLDKFTEPERVRVSLILLGLDPSAPPDVRRDARERGTDVVRALRAGADFAELARELSTDRSSASGGDMGYLHRGMIGEHAQEVIDGLEPGQISEAVVLLEGVAIFRLDERVAPRVNPFEAVRDRAERLWREHARDAAWDGLRADLRASTEIVIEEDER